MVTIYRVVHILGYYIIRTCQLYWSKSHVLLKITVSSIMFIAIQHPYQAGSVATSESRRNRQYSGDTELQQNSKTRDKTLNGILLYFRFQNIY